ncbi:uncharacterized protein BP01DRAFT_16216 [Aspergillus saccharolyticus JOP 1030-1]|uniref:Uncharacterized protein n=1 Tax=Aspergillus saccharolyticus JOP 1030-1 TaxID=1450539 RepID=A0A319AIL0_9EURO|nr:hypothetical protein BP01DRAFT_16216 [Aspergillus saccharolyticus JOP 1030-1]PYH46482.1 hypothetical protein BP01DRAFT_16216 [Aspergillus saccharolyticus JOP 1030-1]
MSVRRSGAAADARAAAARRGCSPTKTRRIKYQQFLSTATALWSMRVVSSFASVTCLITVYLLRKYFLRLNDVVHSFASRATDCCAVVLESQAETSLFYVFCSSIFCLSSSFFLLLLVVSSFLALFLLFYLFLNATSCA